MAVSRPRWVALLWVLGMGSLGLSLWASAAFVPGAVTWQEAVWALLFGSAFLAVGAILVVRRPAAIVGRICLLTGLTMAAAADLRTFAIVLDRQPGPDPPDRRGRRQPLVGRHVVRRPHPRRRPARAVPRRPRSRTPGRPSPTSPSCWRRSASSRACSSRARSTSPGSGCRPRTRSGSRRSRRSAPPTCPDVSLAVYGVSVIASAAILVRRYRRSGSVVRAQIRWVAAAGIVPIVLFLALLGVGSLIPSGVGDALWSAWILSTTLLPIAIGIAILRYRLYDIDRIVSRTISYAILTGAAGRGVRRSRSSGSRRCSSRSRRARPSPSPRPPSWRSPCSSRSGGGSSGPWTAGSTGPASTASDGGGVRRAAPGRGRHLTAVAHELSGRSTPA